MSPATKREGCMVMSINPSYVLKEAGQSFKRNWVMSLGAIITMFLSLLLVGISLYGGVIVNSLVESVESKVSIQVFVKDDAATQDIDVLKRQLEQNAMVKSVTFTTKDQAWENFKETTKDSPEIANSIDENPLPASLDVELKDSRDVESVAASIKSSDVFERLADPPNNPSKSLRYGQETVKKLFAVTKLLRYVGIVFIVMLGLVSLIFINNTIRLAIYARRAEISIMRLVGASNWFIRAPFILEGVMQALIGSILAILTLIAFQTWALPRIAAAVSFVTFSVPGAVLTQISVALVFAGVIFGAIGAWIAMRKYLKV